MLAKIVSTGWLALCASGAAFAQEFFDFGAIPGVPSQPTVQVDLNAALIGFAAAAARVSDPAAADMLEGIEGIRVRVYEELDDAGAVGTFIDDSSARLERDGWQRVVLVQEGDEKVRVYAKLDGDQMSGVTIFVLDSTEAVFVSIAGRIDPTQLGQIAGAMGMGDFLGAFTGGVGRGPQY